MGGYKHPVLVNGQEVNDLSGFDWEQQCYVYVDFVKSGRHFYTVNQQERFYLHRTIIRNRDEEVASLNKTIAKRKVGQKEDTDLVFEFPVIGDGYTCFEADQRLWKINNFVT